MAGCVSASYILFCAALTCSSKEPAVRSPRGRLSARNYKYYCSKLLIRSGNRRDLDQLVLLSQQTWASAQTELVVQQTPLWTLYPYEQRSAVYVSMLRYSHTFYFFFPSRLFSSPAGYKWAMIECYAAEFALGKTELILHMMPFFFN